MPYNVLQAFQNAQTAYATLNLLSSDDATPGFIKLLDPKPDAKTDTKPAAPYSGGPTKPTKTPPSSNQQMEKVKREIQTTLSIAMQNYFIPLKAGDQAELCKALLAIRTHCAEAWHTQEYSRGWDPEHYFNERLQFYYLHTLRTYLFTGKDNDKKNDKDIAQATEKATLAYRAALPPTTRYILPPSTRDHINWMLGIFPQTLAKDAPLVVSASSQGNKFNANQLLNYLMLHIKHQNTLSDKLRHALHDQARALLQITRVQVWPHRQTTHRTYYTDVLLLAMSTRESYRKMTATSPTQDDAQTAFDHIKKMMTDYTHRHALHPKRHHNPLAKTIIKESEDVLNIPSAKATPLAKIQSMQKLLRSHLLAFENGKNAQWNAMGSMARRLIFLENLLGGMIAKLSQNAKPAARYST